MSSKYNELGVDVHKRGIEVFQETVTNLFPEAFCVVSRDPHSKRRGIVLHTDSAGSKPVQAYLHWRVKGDSGAFKGLAQDVIAMNLDDVICVGASPVSFVDYVAINSLKVDKEELLRSLSHGFKECFDQLKGFGMEVSFSGGETADLTDQIRTLDISGTIFGYVEIEKAVTGRAIRPGDRIIGLRSGGKTHYEERLNSGIMCNGITLARHCLMKRKYGELYPEISDTDLKGYYGRFGVDDFMDDVGLTVGEAILSPTRIYAPAIASLIDEFGRDVSGMIHNTGGGQTKCLSLGRNIHYVKDNLFEPDPIFRLIKDESGESWRNMYQIFNMGVGFEVVAREEAADDVTDLLGKFGIEAQVIGRCERSGDINKLTIESPYGRFLYSR